MVSPQRLVVCFLVKMATRGLKRALKDSAPCKLVGSGISKHFEIKKEKTGPLPQNVKYTVVPARSNSAVTEEEKALELFELDRIYKRQTYDEQKEWLLQNTAFFASDVSDEFKAIDESVEDLA